MSVTLWVRKGESGSEEALAFLRRNGYRPDAVLDIAATPPTAEQVALLAQALVVAPGQVGQRTPILLTPKGAVAGFGERKWSAFLGLGPLRG